MPDDKLIITAALSGGGHGRETHPGLPQTPSELANAAVEAHEAGAAIVHVHAWTEDRVTSQDPDLYREFCALVRARCDVVINLTTGASNDTPEDERLAPLELRPELASFDAGSLNFDDEVFLNRPAFLRRCAEELKRAGTRPELEIFDEGMIGNCLRLRAEGLLTDPMYFQFALGIRGGAPATARTLVHLVGSLPEGAIWGATGVGRHAVPVALMTIAMGGHVRVGLEDSVHYRRNQMAESNAQLVRRIARLAIEADRPLATPGDARVVLGLSAPR